MLDFFYYKDEQVVSALFTLVKQLSQQIDELYLELRKHSECIFLSQVADR